MDNESFISFNKELIKEERGEHVCTVCAVQGGV
jgi:hypothetical protein